MAKSKCLVQGYRQGPLIIGGGRRNQFTSSSTMTPVANKHKTSEPKSRKTHEEGSSSCEAAKIKICRPVRLFYLQNPCTKKLNGVKARQLLFCDIDENEGKIFMLVICLAQHVTTCVSFACCSRREKLGGA